MPNMSKAERTLFRERVSACLDEARRASLSASDEYVEKTDERFFERCGGAVLWIYKPSYRFREALKQLQAIDRWLDGQWEIKAKIISEKHKAIRGVTLSKIACRAALNVFQREFPDEGSYSIHAWIN